MLLSKATYNTYIGQTESAVGTIRTFIEPSAKALSIVGLTHSPECNKDSQDETLHIAKYYFLSARPNNTQ